MKIMIEVPDSCQELQETLFDLPQKRLLLRGGCLMNLKDRRFIIPLIVLVITFVVFATYLQVQEGQKCS